MLPHHDSPRGAKNLETRISYFKCWQLIYVYKTQWVETKCVLECQFWPKLTLNVDCAGECVQLLRMEVGAFHLPSGATSSLVHLL